MIKSVKVILILCLAAAACSNPSADEECTTPSNPNGDSELALLMRKMTVHAESERQRLLDGKPPGDYPAEFEAINSATPSSEKSLSNAYGDMADIYIDALKRYHAAGESGDSRFAFNNMLRTCVSCHSNECPGPIRRINKLMIK
jgi:hypothetical protein